MGNSHSNDSSRMMVGDRISDHFTTQEELDYTFEQIVVRERGTILNYCNFILLCFYQHVQAPHSYTYTLFQYSQNL